MKILKLIIICLSLCLTFLIIAYFVNKVMDIPDFLGLWTSGKLLLNGESPYDINAFRTYVYEIDWYFAYPLPTAVLFIPFALIPYRFSYLLWMFLSEVMIFSSVFLLMSLWKIDKAKLYLIPVLIGVVVFRPVIVTIRNGQMGALLLFILVMFMFLYQRHKPFWAGFIVIGELVKPSIGVPILLCLALWVILRRDWKSICGMVAGGILFLVSGLLFDPYWIQKFLSTGQNLLNSTLGYSPTIWGLSSLACQREAICSSYFSFIGIGFVLILTSILLWKKRGNLWVAISLSAIFPLLISPYAWAYEQVLLIVPILYILGLLIVHKWPFMAIGFFVPTVSFLAAVLLIIAINQGSDEWSVILPLIGLIVISVSSFRTDSYELEIIE